MDLSLFQEYYNNGLLALPILWDIKTKQAIAHPEHDINTKEISLQYVAALLQNGYNKSNGVAIKVMPPIGMIDFDIKNTNNKGIFNEWFNIIAATNEDVLKKVTIEQTRSEGYHVYFKYHKLDHKIAIARNEGKEVISIYTGGLLSYCYPTPGYKLIHNDFADIDFLTDDEYGLLVETAAFFNEDAGFKTGDKIETIIDYPPEYENICLQFDTYLTINNFEKLLNSIDLYEVRGEKLRRFKNKNYTPYLREGSTGNYSAKVYYKSKHVLIFSASMPKFPSWHDAESQGDTRWVLTPSRIVYYKNDKDWLKTIAEIKAWSELDDLKLEVKNEPLEPKAILTPDRLKFPYDVFPQSIQDYISVQRIQHEYLAGAVLAALSAAIGNSAYLEAMDGYIVRPVLFMAIIAPPGASKTPALKRAFAPLEAYDAKYYIEYERNLAKYREDLAEAKKNKTAEPEKPEYEQILIKDSTIEMVVKILSFNKPGCCLVADELAGFMNRMNQYKAGDEVQKWLELYSYSPVMIQRIGRDANKVQQPFCSVVGGIQPGVLEALSKGDNAHNGFYHRFLFVYPEVQSKLDWEALTVPEKVKQYYSHMFDMLVYERQNERRYALSEEANTLYKRWFDGKNIKYNKSENEDVKGIISKYQDYCLRFSLLLQAVHDENNRRGVVEAVNMERAIRLTEYFLGNMHKATKILQPETPVDKLKKPWDKLYAALPGYFALKNAISIADKIGIKESAVKMFLKRNEKELFTLIERGVYEKIY